MFYNTNCVLFFPHTKKQQEDGKYHFTKKLKLIPVNDKAFSLNLNMTPDLHLISGHKKENENSSVSLLKICNH